MKPPRPDRRVGLLLAGVLLLTFVGLAATVALPAADPAVAGGEDAVALEDAAKRGMDVYRSEGCWYCHAIEPSADEDLSAADALAVQEPSMLGDRRLGPSFGSGDLDAEAITQALRDPRRDGRLSSMPSYGHLSQQDVDALVAYLLSFSK